MNVALGMCHGEINAVKLEYPQLFTKNMIVTQKLGFADVIAPGECIYSSMPALFDDLTCR